MARFGGTSVNLFVRIAGSYTQIGVGTTTAPVDGDECYFMASGDYLEAGINGVAIAFATDTTYLTATGVGWRVNSSTTILCDSFDVEPLAVPSTADVAWTANFSANGLNDYENVIHRETASVVDDPILGSSRKVLKLTVPNSAIGPTSNPRCQLTPPRRLVADNEFYAGLSILFPSSDFPTVMPVSSSGFLNVAQLFGPPFSSSAPWKLGFRADGTRKLQWKRNGSYSDTAWITPSDVVLDHWYDFVVHMKMSNDPTVGFVEMWMNEGAGWVQQVLSGELKLQMKTQDALTNIIGPSAIDAQLYRLVDMFSSVTVYIGHHSVGHSFDDVKPHSYI